jgi:hypothetical protein
MDPGQGKNDGLRDGALDAREVFISDKSLDRGQCQAIVVVPGADDIPGFGGRFGQRR